MVFDKIKRLTIYKCRSINQLNRTIVSVSQLIIILSGAKNYLNEEYQWRHEGHYISYPFTVICFQITI